MAATATNLGVGYLAAATNVQPGATSGKRTLVLVEAQIATGNGGTPNGLAVPSDNKNNVWSLAYSTTNTNARIHFYVSDGKTAIIPANGDYISLPGNSTDPVFWSLWEITEVDPVLGGSGSASLSFTAGTYSTTLGASNFSVRRGVLVGAVVADDTGTTPKTVNLSDTWTTGSGSGTSTNTAITGYRSFSTNATEATSSSTWSATASISPTGAINSTPLVAFLRVPRERPNPLRAARRSGAAVDRCSSR